MRNMEVLSTSSGEKESAAKDGDQWARMADKAPPFIGHSFENHLDLRR